MLGNIKGTFLSKKKLSFDIYEFTFLCKEPSEINFLPGQYLIIIFSKDNEIKRKYYSISSPLRQSDSIEFIVKILKNGLGSNYLMNLKEGDIVELQGPAGLFFLKENDKQKVLIATGTGIAPMISIIKTHVEDMKNKFNLIWGLKKSEDIYYRDLLRDTAQKYDNFSYEIFLSKEESIDNSNDSTFSGRINIGIDKLLNNFKTNKESLEFYISGDRDIVDSIRTYLIEKQILPENIKLEKFI